MKIFTRVVFSICMVIIFLFAYMLAEKQRDSLYINNEAKKALASSDKFSFFYRSVGYHRDKPTFTYTEDDNILNFYEIARLDNNKNISEYMYIMFYPNQKIRENKNIILNLYFVPDNLSNIEVEDTDIKFNLKRSLKTDMYLAVDKYGSSLIKKSDLETIGKSKIFVGYQENKSLVKILNANLDTTNSFIIKDSLYKYDYNIEKLKENKIFPQVYHLAKQYNYVFAIYIPISLVLISIITYFTYFFHKPTRFRKKSKNIV